MRTNVKSKIALVFAGLLLMSQFGLAQAQTPKATRLRFARGADTINRTGVLTFGGMDRYVIRLGVNDNFAVTATSGNNNVILIIWGADGTVLISDHADASSWQGVTPKTQDYYIDVRAIDGTSANYVLTVSARPIQPGPPHSNIERITFAPGTSSATVAGRLTQGGLKEYVIKANQGQRMLVSVSAEEQRVVLSVVGADGTVLLSSMPGASNFSGTLPSTQDYFLKLTLGGQGFAVYRMTVTIEALVY
jgi:hypothetical protein